MHAGRRVRRLACARARRIPRRSCRRRWSAPSTSRCSTRRVRPVPGMGPSDFIVREDNVAREVLRVVPATDPMHIAILLDNSVAAGTRCRISAGRCRHFIDALMAPAAAGQRNQVAIITLAEPADDSRRLLNRTPRPRQGHRPRLGGNVRRRLLPPERDHRSHPGIQETRVAAPRHRGHHRRRPRAEQPASGPGAHPAARQRRRAPCGHRLVCQTSASATRCRDRNAGGRPGDARRAAARTRSC